MRGVFSNREGCWAIERGVVQRSTKAYKAWGASKCVLRNRVRTGCTEASIIIHRGLNYYKEIIILCCMEQKLAVRGLLRRE